MQGFSSDLTERVPVPRKFSSIEVVAEPRKAQTTIFPLLNNLAPCVLETSLPAQRQEVRILMMQLTYNAIRWDALSYTERARVLAAAKLPAALANASWSQLTSSEQSALYCLDWFGILSS
jgi:hypothetical protein